MEQTSMPSRSAHKYNVVIKGKNIEVTASMKGYINDKITKIEMITTHLINIHVTLSVQKLDHTADITLKFSHFTVHVRAHIDNMYLAIDKAFERLYTKLRKWKGRIQDHHAKGVSATEMEICVLESAQHALEELNKDVVDENNRTLEKDFALPKVVKKKKRTLKVLTLDEAVMKMELSDDHFMIFRSEEECDLKIIYRRRDGSYGVISPE